MINNQRCINLKCENSYMLNCVSRKYSSNPTGKIGTSSYRPNEKVIYTLEKDKQYNLYLDTINRFATHDNIHICPLFIEFKDGYHENGCINFPYIYTSKILVTIHKIKAYLMCSIKY